MTRLNIKINKISYKLEKKLAKAVIIKGNYRKLTDKQLDKLNNYPKNCSFIFVKNMKIRNVI